VSVQLHISLENDLGQARLTREAGQDLGGGTL